MKARLEIALILSAVFFTPAVGHARWSAEPVTVHATTDECPLVAAASDAQDGAIVVWQQEGAAGSRLFAKHLLANGDVDAAWPAAGASVCSVAATRDALGAIGDGSGGAYVWWMEDVALYLTRVLADGTVAAGWPARGKSLGWLLAPAFRPLAFPDGQGGIWLGWLTGAPLYTAGCIAHLGPDGLGAGGWPDGVSQFAISSMGERGLQTLAFSFAPAPDGGAWVAWGDAMHDANGYHAGSWRLVRLVSEGYEAPGWELGSVPVRDFHGELLVNAGAGYSPSYPPYFATSLVAVASDGAGGAYLLVSDVAGGPTLMPKLFHRDSTGAADPSWPVPGVVPGAGFFREGVDWGADFSPRLFPEAAGGVFALSDFVLTRFTPAATQTEWSTTEGRGLECIVPSTGDTYLASYCSNIPFRQQYPFSAIELKQTYASGAAGPGFLEWNDYTQYCFYMDVGLAPASNAGAIFAWSQSYERQGVFARRFAQAGQVAGVEPVSAVPRVFRLRFAPGRGVVATLGAVAAGRIELHDVMGRVCFGTEVPAGAREVAIAGTATIAPGLYFAQHRGADGSVETGRVVIVR